MEQRSRCFAVLLLWAVVTINCGGGHGGQVAGPTPGPGPAATPTPPPPPPEFRDGWSEENIAAEIDPAAPGVGVRTLVKASGYLQREALFDGKPYYLWPGDESYARALVYTEYSPGQRLSRWEQGFQIAGGPELAVDPRVPGILADAAAEASRATGLPISIRESGSVTVILDPAEPYFATHDAVAFTRLGFSGNAIVSARIFFRDLKYLLGTGNRVRTNTVLHEIGHVLGLGHSPDGRDVMHVDGLRTDARQFSDREQVLLRMMYRWRKPGNAAPDRDAALEAALEGYTTVMIE
jgi:hypothetical protein